jgi:thiol-disulfide isomerase/thioredoxin
VSARGCASALLAALGAAAGCGPATAPPIAPPPASVEVVDLAGLDAAIRSRQGKPLLLNFWALWCQPCVQELPDLVAIGKGFRERGGEVLGISLDLMAAGTTLEQVQEKMTPFLRDRGIDFPILIYADGDPAALLERFDLPGAIPVTLALGRDGKVVDRHEGMAEREDFARLADRAAGR